MSCNELREKCVSDWENIGEGERVLCLSPFLSYALLITHSLLSQLITNLYHSFLRYCFASASTDNLMQHLSISKNLTSILFLFA